MSLQTENLASSQGNYSSTGTLVAQTISSTRNHFFLQSAFTHHEKRQFFFYTNMVWAKNILPEKVRNLDKSNLRQNSVKGPKDTNNTNKMPKSNIKFQNVPKNANRKRKIATLLTFLTKQRKI